MNKIKILAIVPVLMAVLMGASKCDTGVDGSIDGNIINTRVTNGVTEVQVKDLVDQGPEDAPWVAIPAGKEQACTVGDRYPDCLG